MLKNHLQTKKAIKNKWYEGIIKLRCVGLKQTTNNHGNDERGPMLQK